MEGVRRDPPNAVRHHGEEKEEEEVKMSRSYISPPSLRLHGVVGQLYFFTLIFLILYLH
jgi:hypothetical protein